MVSVTPRPLFTPGKDPIPIIQEAGWGPGPFWTGEENLAPHRDSIPGPSKYNLSTVKNLNIIISRNVLENYLGRKILIKVKVK